MTYTPTLSGQRRSVSLVAFMLTAIPALGMFGIFSTVGGHPTAPEATPLLSDNFTQDSQLNGSTWRINGNATQNATGQVYPHAIVPPGINFSSTQGLEMSGVSGADMRTGIESLSSFYPPFVANVSVMGTSSHGAAFLFVLTNPSSTRWLAVDGYLNSGEGTAYGIGLDVRDPASGGGWMYLGNLVSSPSLGRWYDVTIEVSQNGLATVGVGSQGQPLGTMRVDIGAGAGPFVLGLMQAENSPPTVGNNVADWAQVSVLPIPMYRVTFSESGLPSGTNWSVTMNSQLLSSTTNSISFSEPNGSYTFSVGTISGYRVSPMSGSVTINGTDSNVSVIFTPQPPSQYSLIFSETGLPIGTNWSVTVGTTIHTSTVSTINFTELNGTYPYTVGMVVGYTAMSSSGSVTVNGTAKTVFISFAKANTETPYAVTFIETGLPFGANWSVTFNGSTKSSTTTTIIFQEPNGSYAFTVASVNGYSPNPSSGPVKVTGAAVTQSITFRGSTSNGKTNQTSGVFGLPGQDGYILIGGIVAAVVAATAALVFLKGRKKKGIPGDGVQDTKNIVVGTAEQVAVK